MSRPLAAALTLLASLAFTAAPALALSESEAIAAFAASSPRLASARAAVAEARAAAVAASARPNPSLGFAREQTFNANGPTEQNRLAMSWPWNVGGKRELRIERTELGIRAAEARLRQTRHSLLIELRDAYARAHFAEAHALRRAAHLATLRRLDRMLEARQQAGEAAGADRARMRLATAGAEASAAAARAEAVAARALLAGLLGAPVAGPLVPPDTRGTRRASDAFDAELAALEAERAQARLALTLADRQVWTDPQVEAGALQTNEPTVQGLGYVAGVAWPLPISDRGQGDRARAEAELSRIEHALSTRRQMLNHALPGLREALALRREAAARYAARALGTLDGLTRAAEVGYAEGETPLLALLDAHEAALAARERHLTLSEEAHDALLALERLAGAPPADPETP